MSGSARGRVLPAASLDYDDFWHGGEHGELRIRSCDECGRLQHPPYPVCIHCRSMSVGSRSVSGRAVVAAYTINQHPWFPDLTEPYVVAIVELEEDPTVRLTTSIVDCEVDEVRIGLPVEVRFEQHDDVWLPLFAPRREAHDRSPS